MNKRYLAISIFLAVLALFSLFQAIRSGFSGTPISLCLVFSFLSYLFFRNVKR